MFPLANACSYPIPETQADNSIVSNMAFSNEYPAGAELNEVFDVTVYKDDYHRLRYWSDSLEEYDELASVTEFAMVGPPAPQRFVLNLLQSPQYEEQQFFFSITMSDGDVHEFNTQALRFEL